jgi:hypothetical protein
LRGFVIATLCPSCSARHRTAAGFSSSLLPFRHRAGVALASRASIDIGVFGHHTLREQTSGA